MVRHGFIHAKEDIKFLILFAMDLLPFPVSFSTVVDLTTWCDEGFGYFELSEAFYEMIPTGHIEERKDGSGTLYRITDKGREAIRVFEKQLPYPVREAAQRSALQALEPDFGMLLFVVGGFEEDVPDLLIALLLGLRGVEGVFVARLAFAGKRRHQVGFGTASLEFHSCTIPFGWIFRHSMRRFPRITRERRRFPSSKAAFFRAESRLSPP